MIGEGMKYQSVIEHIESMIKIGKLSSGSKLPSARILAHEMCCSKSTVIKGYDTLVQNKLAYSIDKSGYFLMNNPENRLICNRLEFNHINCVNSVLVTNDIQQLLNKSFLSFTRSEDQDLEGYYPLRGELKRYFRKRKLFCGSHDIFIMPTFVQCVHLILSLNGLNEGVLVEEPIDISIVNLFKRRQSIHTLSRENPIDFNLLELLILKEKIKVLYITPHVHIPTGQSMDLMDKKRLLDICYKYGVTLVEINHFEDAFKYEESQSLYALDKHDIVFHIKTFNKFVSNDINIVALVTPKTYTSKVKYYKEVVLGKTTLFEQLLLKEYLLSDIGTNKLIQIQEKKFNLLKTYLSELKGYEIYYTDAPLFAFIKVPFHYNLETMVLELNKLNIIIESAKDYFIKEHSFKGVMLSINTVNEHELHVGLQAIINILIANRR